MKMGRGARDRAAMYDSLTPSECRACRCDLVAMIRDDLRTAMGRALGRAGLPEPAGGIALDPARSREHGDWASNVALQLKGRRRRAAARHRGADQGRARGRAGRASRQGRDRGPGFPQSLPRAHVAARRAARCGRGGRAVRPLDGARRAGGSTSSSSRRTRPGPLHAGGGRWVAVGDAIANLLAAQGAEVHREYYLNDAGAQLDMFRDSLYARYQRAEAARGRLPGPVPRRHGGAAARRARRRRHPRRRVRMGLPPGRAGPAGRSRPRRRALRHLVLRAHAARARRRRRRARAARRRRVSSTRTTARAGCARPTSATSATACSCAATAAPPISATTSRTTATSSGAASRT